MEEVTTFLTDTDNLATIISIITGIGTIWKGVPALYKKWRNYKISNDLHPFFEYNDVKEAVRYFVPTQVQNIPPSKENEPGQTHAFVTREKLIPFFMNKGFKQGGDNSRFYLLLADSGMGKTTFMINLFVQYNSLFNFKKKYKIRLMPIKDDSTMTEIKKIKGNDEEKNTILLLDAFDEDPEATKDYQKRLDGLMKEVKNFREVVITSRTQFFKSAEDEPTELKIPKSGPDGGFHVFRKMYVSPFDDKDIAKYLKRRFGLFGAKKRKKAWEIINKAKRLMARPMLLSYVHLLLESDKDYHTSAEIYEVMVEKWIEREANRQPTERRKQFSEELYRFSQQIAKVIYEKWRSEGILELSHEEVMEVLQNYKIQLDDFEATGRSLLTRNTHQEWKFAHKSIMEYFIALGEKEKGFTFMNFDGMDACLQFCDELGVVNLMAMVLVEGGTFEMGYKKGRDGKDEGMNASKPSHSVTLDSFYMAKYPVTQALYEAVMGKNPSNFKGQYKPVDSVSWEDAQEFIEKLNHKTGQRYRLPTEAEWEFAARGGVHSKGFMYAGSNDIGQVAWYAENSYDLGKNHKNYGTNPVGKKDPNELGLYDMTGNVWEWCNDWYDEGYYAHSAKKNPQVANSGDVRVLRGGSWYNFSNNCRVSLRFRDFPNYRSDHFGFRLSRDR